MILFLWTSFVFLSDYYFCADARYAKDNFNYLTEQMVKAGIIKEQPKTVSRLYPSVFALSGINRYSAEWTEAYLGGFDKANVVPDPDEDPKNPYDTLSKLVVSAYDNRAQKIYDFVVVQEAYLNPDAEIDRTESAYSQWNETYNGAEAESISALYSIQNTFVSRIVIICFSFSFSIFLFVCSLFFINKNKNN